VAWNPDGPVAGGRNKPYTVRGVAAPPGGGMTCLGIAPGGGAIVVGWGDGSVGVFADGSVSGGGFKGGGGGGGGAMKGGGGGGGGGGASSSSFSFSFA
jgi:hypothetical protein